MPSYDFDKQTAERIVRAVREVESRPRERREIERPPGFGEPIPVWIRNEGPSGSDTLPAFGVAAIVGSTVVDGFPVILVEKPSTTFRKGHIANGPFALVPTDYGLGYVGDSVEVMYSTAPTTSFEGYGAVPGSYKLDKFYPQCSESLGIVNSSTVSGSSDTPTMLATLHPIRELIVKAGTANFAQNASTDLEILAGTGGSETTIGQRATIVNLGQTISSSQIFTALEVNGQFYADNGADVKLAVDSSNVGMYASTLFSPWNESTQYEVNKDFDVEFEAQGTTPNQSVRGFIDSDSYPGYVAGEEQVLGKDAADALQWTTLGAQAVDEKLAASSENSGVYWNQLHDSGDVNATSVFNSTQDFRVETEIFGTTPNQTIKLFVDVSDIANWTGAGHQFFMTGANADIVLRNANNINVTTVYNSTQDFLVEPELDGSNLIFMIDNSAITDWAATTPQFLYHDSSGGLKWTSSPAAAGTDELLAATSENSGVYWNALHADVNGTSVFNSTQDLKVESEIFGTTPNQTIKLFVDASDIAGWSATVRQVLGHTSGGGLEWIAVSTCT